MCFGDGLAEEIVNVLAQIHRLKVTARTSAFALRTVCMKGIGAAD